MFFKTQLYINKIHVIINANAMYISYWYISYIFISTRYLRYRVPVRDLNVIKLPGVKVLINKVTKTYVSMINEVWTDSLKYTGLHLFLLRILLYKLYIFFQNMSIKISLWNPLVYSFRVKIYKTQIGFNSSPSKTDVLYQTTQSSTLFFL